MPPPFSPRRTRSKFIVITNIHHIDTPYTTNDHVEQREKNINILYRGVYFTENYTTRKIHTKLHPGP